MTHPFGVATGQIVVYRNNMHAFSGQCVQVRRQRGRQGLALTGFHFCNFALMQHDSADQLDIKMPHFQSP